MDHETRLNLNHGQILSPHTAHQPKRMNWTPPSQDKSNAPAWLKTSLTLLYRFLCGLLVLGALVPIAAHVLDIPIHFNTIRMVSLFFLAGGSLSITNAWRTWLMRLPVTTRFSPPVPYGYPGWRSILQSQLVGGCFLFVFGALLSLL
ncbi:hypothetical protein C2L65_31660 [Paraburkholderia terrae]|uniref:Uncharacterized protein n=1 Tax=Paraburkholderia terrae TaxID=311230 RepID=A0A2I8EXD2_9BURK|nr:hypothetical protein C2L65_31660 [Paraburkholderia terrae]